MKRILALAWVLAGCTWAAGARAQVYRCVAHGQVAYQDQPCARGQRQTLVAVPSHPPPAYVPPPPPSALPSATRSVLPPPAAVPPSARAALPVLYACVGAVNGKHYLTRTPPGSYLAPLGVMGYPPQSLSQVYGATPQRPESVPAMAPRVRIGGPPFAAGMTEVRDACAPATRARICSFVQHEYASNQHKLNLTMPHAQPPYAARARHLEAQLQGC